VWAVENGVVTDTNYSTMGGTGRHIAVDLDDGRRTRSLHLSEIWVRVGQRVSRGQQLGLTGASGFGSNWGYGAHVHETLLPNHANEFRQSLDFELYVSGEPAPPKPPPPPDEEDDMLMLNLKTGPNVHKVALGVGVLRHFVPGDPYELIKNISRSRDDWQDIDIADFPALIVTYGIDRNAYKVANNVLTVLDPLTGKYGPGVVWTNVNARYADENVVKPPVEPPVEPPKA
jgi:hypothetical protein